MRSKLWIVAVWVAAGILFVGCMSLLLSQEGNGILIIPGSGSIAGPGNGLTIIPRPTALLPIAYDNAAGLGDGATNTITISSFAVGAGVNRLLVVVAGARDDTTQADRDVSGVTYGGVALTKLKDQDDAIRNVEIWYLIAPATGSANVVVTLGGNPLRNAAVAISFSGVDQTTPFEASNSGTITNNASPSTSITAITTGAWLVDGIFSNEAEAAIEVNVAQVRRYRDSATAPTYTFAASTKASVTTGANVTQWTGGSATNDWAWVVGAIKPN